MGQQHVAGLQPRISACSRQGACILRVLAEHWKHLRTTNIIESSFATIRHHTVRSKGCLSNKSALAMIFKLAEGAEKSWRPPRWLHPVAETHPPCKVHRRNRGCQSESSSRCRLISSVTKIRR